MVMFYFAVTKEWGRPVFSKGLSKQFLCSVCYTLFPKQLSCRDILPDLFAIRSRKQSCQDNQEIYPNRKLKQ